MKKEIQDNIRKEIVKTAGDAMERNDFKTAIELYRRSLEEGDFSPEVVGNLSICMDLEEIAFAYCISTKYGWKSRLYLAETLMQKRRYTQAIEICGTLLKDYKLQSNHELTVRLIRFRSACRIGEIKCLHEDFTRIWNSKSGSAKSSESLKKIIISEIGKVEDTKLLISIEEIAQNESSSQELAKMLRSILNTKDMWKKYLFSLGRTS